MDVSDAKRLGGLEAESARLKQLLADTLLDNAALKEIVSKTGNACGTWWEARLMIDGQNGQYQPARPVMKINETAV